MSDSLTASRSDTPTVPERPTEPEIIVPAPTPTSAPTSAAVAHAPAPSNGPMTTGAAVPPATSEVSGEPLARIEDKTSRIEEKLARSEDSLQRVVGRFDLATNRMNEVATQAELTAVRGEVSFIARRMRNVPGWTALLGSSLVTAFLTAILFILLLRFFPGLLTR